MSPFTTDSIRLSLQNGTRSFQATLCLTHSHFDELVTENFVRPYLHAQELAYFVALPQSPRRHSYLLGRYCAKQALAQHLGVADMADMLIETGVFLQPVVDYPHIRGMQISISHGQDTGAALVFEELHPMGVDIETPDAQRTAVIDHQVTKAERQAIHHFPWQQTGAFSTWIWTAKEALSKALRTGLTVPLELYEVTNIHREEQFVIADYIHFAQYKVMSFMWNSAIVSIAFPKQSVIQVVANVPRRR